MYCFRPSDKRNSEREEQKLVMRGSDVAFKVPNTVKNIKTWAFSGCRGLTSVAMG